MKNKLPKIIMVTCIIILSVSFEIKAQVCEWRLANAMYNSADPDGAGPATGSATFTLQIHTTGATINNVNQLATGWSYQSTAAMIPTSPGCAVVSNPANVTVSAPFTAGGFTYTTVNQCAPFSQTSGGKTFDRTVAGSLDGTGINLTTTWIDVFTATLWTLGTAVPQGGYVIINSSSLGSPGPLASYSVSDNMATEYPANSLTYTTPLALGSGTLPVVFTKFEGSCTNNGTLVSWSTASEFNSDYFEIQRSSNGNDWSPVANIKALGTSSRGKAYQQLDISSGGNAFYRIKQVDVDGHFIYTNVVRTNCERKNIDIVIYPVPAHDVLNVVVRSDRSLKTQLNIYDGVGKLVKKIDAAIVNGNNNFNINLKGLAGGEYIIRSNNADLSIDKRFTIIR